MTLRDMTRRARVTPATALIGLSATGSVTGVALGIDALSGGGQLPWAIPAAGGLLVAQLLCGLATRAGGGVGLAARATYAIPALGAAFLAVGAVAEVSASGRIAQKSFEKVAAGAAYQIERVQAADLKTAERLRGAATYSAAMARREAAQGNTCGVSDGGGGPIMRLRDRHASELSAISQQFQVRIQGLSRSRLLADSAIASYTVATHAQVAQTVNGALGQARITAQAGALGGQREAIAKLLAETQTGATDPKTGEPVVCLDKDLAQRLTAILETPDPAIPAAAPMPNKPTHDNVVRGLFVHIAAVLAGKESFDWEAYGFSLIGILPESTLILGLAWLKRERRAARGPFTDAAEAAGVDPEDDDPLGTLQTAAEDIANDRMQTRVSPFVVRDTSWFGGVDYLRIPDDEAHRDIITLAEYLVEKGYLVDKGVWRAGDAWASFKPAPADPEALAHFFRFKRNALRLTHLEALRRAVARLKAARQRHRYAAE